MTAMGALLEHLWAAAAATNGAVSFITLEVTAAASALAWLALRTRGELRGLRPLALIALLGGIAGGFGLGFALRLPGWIASGFEGDAPIRGGLMAFGLLFGWAATYAALARARGFNVGVALDRIAPPMGLLVIFARAGCFLGGCDFGTATSLPWGVRFPEGTEAHLHHIDAGLLDASAAMSLPVHPTQLYESLVGLIAAAAALLVARRRLAPGAAFASAAATYAVGRFLVELLRGDAMRGSLGALSTPQWLCISVLAWAASFLASRPAPAPSSRGQGTLMTSSPK